MLNIDYVKISIKVLCCCSIVFSFKKYKKYQSARILVYHLLLLFYFKNTCYIHIVKVVYIATCYI